jgi:Bacterial Ig-like domain (group 1)
MRKFWSTLALATLAAIFAGCGGNPFETPTTGGGGGPGTGSGTVASLTATSASPTISADSTSSTGITVVAEDVNHVAVAGAVISFKASAGALQVTQATTDASGKATAVLSANGAAAGTSIIVTATTPGVTQPGTVTVMVSATQQTLTLLTSTPQIFTDGSASAKITALVRDSNNNVLAGVAVSFTATAGALTNIQGTTDATGSATAQLTNAGDPTNRTITVSATAGASSATVNVAVVGTTLQLSGPATLVQGSTGTYTVSLTDYGKNGIGSQTVMLTSALGNTLTPSSVTTTSSGQQTFTLKAVNAGSETITATALGLTTTSAVTVSAQNFSFSAPAASPVAQVPVGQANAIPVTVVWQGGANQNVTLSTSRGTFIGGVGNNGSSTTAMTDGTGTTSGITLYSTQAGPATITATGTGVTAQVIVDFVATTPNTLAVQASPSTITTQGQSTIIATVRDVNNNLVPGQSVSFTLNDITGGSLSLSSATTNSQGEASVVYTATSKTSSTNGVQVTATVGNLQPVSTYLTVGGQTVSLTLGTGNTLTVVDQTTYSLPYTAILADSGGHALTGVQITFTLTPAAFVQGKRTWNGTQWVTGSSTAGNDAHVFSTLETLYNDWGCANEDANNNGIFDAGDYNENGLYNINTNNTATLYPGTVANLGAPTPSTGTDASGRQTVNITYLKDHAYYAAIILTATATVSGNQSTTSAIVWLPGFSQDFSQQSVSPPGPQSPYGQRATCGGP